MNTFGKGLFVGICLLAASPASANAPSFSGTPGGNTFVPAVTLWGMESQNVRGKFVQHDLVVFMSDDPDACAHWPRSLTDPGRKAFIMRLSKLDRTKGSVTFVDPDVGMYDVMQPSDPSALITRGAEVSFHTMSDTVDKDADIWLAASGAVQLDRRVSLQSDIEGHFSVELLPFALDEEPSGPSTPVAGTFVAQRCSAMDSAAP